MTKLKNKKRKSKRHEIAYKKILVGVLKLLKNSTRITTNQNKMIENKDSIIELKDELIKIGEERIKRLVWTVKIEVVFLLAMAMSNFLVLFHNQIINFLTKLYLIF